MTPRWNAASALAALLDALEADLLGVASKDVQAALRETGRAREGAVQEVRALLHDAGADSHDGCPLALPCGKQDGMGTRRH